MNGAIFFSGQYGSTAQYANWIGETTGLPAFDVNDGKADPSEYDYLILGTSVIIYKLTIRKWVESHLAGINDKPTLLFTVSGDAAGPELDGWIDDSLPASVVSRSQHVALRGRLQLESVSWWVMLILKIDAWKNKDPEGKRQEPEGFDFMDKSGIEPIVDWVLRQQPDLRYYCV